MATRGRGEQGWQGKRSPLYKTMLYQATPYPIPPYPMVHTGTIPYPVMLYYIHRGARAAGHAI